MLKWLQCYNFILNAIFAKHIEILLLHNYSNSVVFRKKKTNGYARLNSTNYWQIFVCICVVIIFIMCGYWWILRIRWSIRCVISDEFRLVWNLGGLQYFADCLVLNSELTPLFFSFLNVRHVDRGSIDVSWWLDTNCCCFLRSLNNLLFTFVCFVHFQFVLLCCCCCWWWFVCVFFFVSYWPIFFLFFFFTWNWSYFCVSAEIALWLRICMFVCMDQPSHVWVDCWILFTAIPRSHIQQPAQQQLQRLLATSLDPVEKYNHNHLN